MKSTTVLVCRWTKFPPRCARAGPIDDEEDYALPIWAGVVPLRLKMGDPLPDARLQAELREREPASIERRRAAAEGGI